MSKKNYDNYDNFDDDFYDKYVDVEKENKILQAKQKNEDLIKSLESQRLNFCGIGTNKAKRRLNKFVKEDYVADFLRVALEAEDENIIAKKTYGKYRDKVYESKYKLIKKLYEISIKNNIKCGIQEIICPMASHVIYFHTPNTNAQISWHITPDQTDQFIKYTEEWDKLENSTLDKLEVEITQYLFKKNLLKDANLIPVERTTKAKNYTVGAINGRFAIYDKENKIVDDAQGYGYKTVESAEKVIWYKFRKGRQKIEETKKEAREVIKNHITVARDMYDLWISYFKEIARDEITLDDISNWIKEKHNMDISSRVISLVLDLMVEVIRKEEEIEMRKTKNEKDAMLERERQAALENFDIKVLPFKINRFAIYNKRGEIFDKGNCRGCKTERAALNVFLTQCNSKKNNALKKEIEILIEEKDGIVEYIEELYASNNQDKIKENVKQKYNEDITKASSAANSRRLNALVGLLVSRCGKDR